MLIQLPDIWIYILNILIWLFIHLTIAYWATLLPFEKFTKNNFLFKIKYFETTKFYEKYFLIKRWKHLLPDGASLFKRGFKKKRLMTKEKDYFLRFMLETRRGEFAHWLVILFSPVFFIWNPFIFGVVNIIYSLIANLPCIFVQRYNRIRFSKLL